MMSLYVDYWELELTEWLSPSFPLSLSSLIGGHLSPEGLSGIQVIG